MYLPIFKRYAFRLLASGIFFYCWFGAASASYAKNLYVAQNPLGLNTGANCANAHSAVWFNDPANWANAADKITPGDTVHLCGTLTTNLTVQSGGLPNQPLTILFEPNAKMTKPTWNGSAIQIYGWQNYIIIDGGRKPDDTPNGIIEATDNGTAGAINPKTGRPFGNQTGSYGINFGGVSHDYIEVKNLIIRDMYVRTPYSTDTCECGVGISVVTGSHGSIHHNIVSNATNGIWWAYGNESSDVEIYANEVSRTRWGIAGGDSAVNASMTDLRIHDNRIYDGYVWDGIWANGDWFHVNGVYFWAESGGRLNGLKMYRNTIGGDLGTHNTGWLFTSGNICFDPAAPCEIHDNVLYATGVSTPSNGLIAFGPWAGVGGKAKIYNNTLVGGYLGMIAPGSTINNNLIAGNGYTIISTGSATNAVLPQSDYNLFFGFKDNGDNFYYRGCCQNIPTWQSWGLDTHSLIRVDPQFVNAPKVSAVATRRDNVSVTAYIYLRDADIPQVVSLGDLIVINGDYSAPRRTVTEVANLFNGDYATWAWRKLTFTPSYSGAVNYVEIWKPTTTNFTRDFRLSATSPAIRAGINLGGSLTDIVGTPRPATAPWSIGAYEFLPAAPLRPSAPGSFRIGRR